MRHRIRVVLGSLLILSLALAGCGQKITAEQIVDKMRETMESTQDAHAVVEVNVDVQGVDMSATAEVWEKSPNKLRVEVIEASEARFARGLLVSDGQQAWFYEPLRNQVTVGPMGEVELPLPQEVLNSLQEVIQEVLDASDVELAGEKTVVGREAYQLTLSPREGSEQEIFPGNGTATLWVDKEQWIVLKATYEASSFGEGGMEVQSFELNPGLTDDLFHFEVPEGAKVVDVEAQQPQPLTLEEAREQAGFQLLLPDYLPGGVTLIEVFRMADSIILRYDHSPQVAFTVVQGSELVGTLPLGQAQTITLRGQDATVVTDEVGGNAFLYWTEDGVMITIAGHIGLDEALKVAESLR